MLSKTPFSSTHKPWVLLDGLFSLISFFTSLSFSPLSLHSLRVINLFICIVDGNIVGSFETFDTPCVYSITDKGLSLF